MVTYMIIKYIFVPVPLVLPLMDPKIAEILKLFLGRGTKLTYTTSEAIIGYCFTLMQSPNHTILQEELEQKIDDKNKSPD